MVTGHKLSRVNSLPEVHITQSQTFKPSFTHNKTFIVPIS